MKRILTLLAIVSLSFICAKGQTIISPTIKSKTSFAIIVDSKSFNEARAEIESYRKVIEADGLGTYVISNDWKNPEEIRSKIVELYGNKKSPLEGVVFIGDIPIPMLRDAQHLTSAFKMNQKRDWQQSSVPSDRYYDDFEMKYDFLKQDSINPLYFYYSLRADSRQFLKSEIYSARIKPLEKGKKDKYSQLRDYLKKVVSVRTSEKNNTIENLTVARGYGYNSESRVAWSGEQLALKEQFPTLFNAGNFVKFMDFDSYWPMKSYWLNEVQRPDLDIMLFHHHGANDYQYISGYKSGNDVNTSKENIKVYLRSKIAEAVKKGKDKDEAIKYYVDQLDVPRSWCEEAFDPELMAKDSVMNETLGVKVSDILSLTPQARFIMFDACFNGSFYEDEYIAGAYIFNDGKTIVTQGNTVNAIQDKWPDEFLGLFDYGIRVGEWGKQVHFLETHIIGDPTFRFAKKSNTGFDINLALTVEKNNVSFWKKALTNPSVDIQAIALRMLFENNYKDISSLLKQTYFNSPSMIVRLEALQLLSKIDDDNFIEVLSAATSDSYELTRRFAIEYALLNGSDKLIPALAKTMLNDNTSKRVISKITMGYRLVNLDKLELELKKQMSERNFYDKSLIDSYFTAIDNTRKSVVESLTVLTDKDKKVKDIAFEIGRYRNHPISDNADVLINIVQNNDYDISLRLASAEALGWFNYSYKRSEIVDKLKNILPSIKDATLSNETTKTINRLANNE